MKPEQITALAREYAEEEGKLLGVSRKQIDALQSEIIKAIMDAHDDDDWQDAAHYILDVMPRSFAALFGSKCLPYETKNGAKDRAKEPKPAEPKFKIGDKVRIVDDNLHNYKHKGEVTEIVSVDKSDIYVPYKVDIYDEDYGGGLWYSESDLEPYTEPTENYVRVDYHGADTAASTIADSCQSQPVTDYFDRIIKDGFRGHNRLHIAAMMVPSVIATVPCSENEKGYAKMVATRARILADALISECKKGGGNA